MEGTTSCCERKTIGFFNSVQQALASDSVQPIAEGRNRRKVRFHDQNETVRLPLRSCRSHDADYDALPVCDVNPEIPLELHEWHSHGYDPATHLLMHAHVQRRLAHSDVELQAARLMAEPLELQPPAMLAYCSFPESWFSEVGLTYADIQQLEHVTVEMDQHAFAAKEAGAIAAKRMIISTNKTEQHGSHSR